MKSVLEYKIATHLGSRAMCCGLLCVRRYPIYVCIGMQDRDPSWQSSYVLWPAGVCHRVMSANQRLDAASWGNQTGGFADKWIHPSGSFDSRTWERVANDEMWHSKYVTIYIIGELGTSQNIGVSGPF